MSGMIDYLADVFLLLGPIRTRRMFGGYGVYRDDLMFGLIADDVLYLKADAESAAAFQARGLPAFEYEKAGKAVQMSYYRAPEEIFDDPELAKAWGTRALEAALRSGKPKKKASRNTAKKRS